MLPQRAGLIPIYSRPTDISYLSMSAWADESLRIYEAEYGGGNSAATLDPFFEGCGAMELAALAAKQQAYAKTLAAFDAAWKEGKERFT